MLKAKVIMVTDPSAKNIVEGMKMTWCESIDKAIETAKAIKPDYNGITLVPDGISVIVR
jgi:nickel-dependent lactate racemase